MLHPLCVCLCHLLCETLLLLGLLLRQLPVGFFLHEGMDEDSIVSTFSQMGTRQKQFLLLYCGFFFTELNLTHCQLKVMGLKFSTIMILAQKRTY